MSSSSFSNVAFLTDDGELAKRGQLLEIMSLQGQLGAHDLIIGSTALSLGFSLAIYIERRFGRIEGLELRACPFNRKLSFLDELGLSMQDD